MNLGKCTTCAKSVYDLEGYTVGPPGKKKIYHKLCFKCATCGWQLNMTNYKFWEDEAYCKNHYPVTGFGDQNAKHVHGVVSTDSRDIEPQLRAPKLDTYNNQVRGTGEKPNVDREALGVKTATGAPKLDTFNQTVRGGK